MARRRSNGEGTTYRRMDRDGWAGQIYVTTHDGRRKRVVRYGKTEAEVRKKLNELRVKNDQGIPTVDKSWKLADYLDYWLEQIVKPKRRASTYAQCEQISRLYLKPGLGRYTLEKLSVPLVQGYINDQLASGQSLAQAHVIRKVLSATLTRAMREELVTRNVARLVELETVETKEVSPWTSEEITRFLEAARTHMWYPAFLLMLHYGLRRGEVLGLRWEDVDFENGVIHIRQQLLRVGRELMQGPLKTKASRRTLPLFDNVETELRDLYERRIVPASLSHNLTFTTSVGSPIEPRNFVRAFQGICRRHGLRLIRIHDIRHTTATLLKDEGVPTRDTQVILGHSNASTTLLIYEHTNMPAKRKALSRIEAVLAKTSETETPQAELGEGLAVVDGSRSRQVSRQGHQFDGSLTSFLSGAIVGGRTRDLILTMKMNDTVDRRVTGVDVFLQDGRRRWMVGVVAVNLAVKYAGDYDVDLAT